MDKSGFGPYFQHFIISGELGVRKPDPAYYERTLEIIGAPEEECLFIDDRAENCAAAQRLGISAIRFESADQLERALPGFHI